ncbi:hypothetical protein PTTG_25861 [Puccinia triticina 1-1 BBBD Race 1]|uniref:Ras-GEF domain-containing protein n=1 Tax=Puccinia triticina (isolate 1-1 / race 1 (BBBD)) TaxID=630390 RepID=A0A180GYR7_PUCT1|nr:hypothetical protein PTTG_25861 [Puccinia triticina 1-1 BBBD Race 1]
MRLGIGHLLIWFSLTIIKCNGYDEWLYDFDAIIHWEPPTAEEIDQLMSSLPPMTASSPNYPESHCSFTREEAYPQTHLDIPFLISAESHGGFSSPPVFSSPLITTGGGNPQSSGSVNQWLTASCDPGMVPSGSQLPSVPQSPLLPAEGSLDLNQSVYGPNRKRKFHDPLLNALDEARLKPLPRSWRPHRLARSTRKVLTASQASAGTPFTDSHGTTSLQASTSSIGASTTSSIIKPPKKRIIWAPEILDHPDDSNRQLITWFAFSGTKKCVAEFPSIILTTQESFGSQCVDMARNASQALRRLVFDENTFTSHTPNTRRFRSNIIELIGKLPTRLDPVKGTKLLVMTPDQIVRHHTHVNWHEPDDEDFGEGDNEILKNEEIELVKTEQLRDTIINFLVFVEMIDSIVPDKRKEKEGFSGMDGLEEAFLVLENLFNPEKQDSNRSREYLLNKLVLKSKAQSKTPAMWKLVGAWLQTFRQDFVAKILGDRLSMDTVKSFFNTIFYCSIENLSTQIVRNE